MKGCFSTKFSRLPGHHQVPPGRWGGTDGNGLQVSDFVQMTGPPEPHHILREKGLLHEWQPGQVGGLGKVRVLEIWSDVTVKMANDYYAMLIHLYRTLAH